MTFSVVELARFRLVRNFKIRSRPPCSGPCGLPEPAAANPLIPLEHAQIIRTALRSKLPGVFVHRDAGPIVRPHRVILSSIPACTQAALLACRLAIVLLQLVLFDLVLRDRLGVPP